MNSIISHIDIFFTPSLQIVMNKKIQYLAKKILNTE